MISKVAPMNSQYYRVSPLTIRYKPPNKKIQIEIPSQITSLHQPHLWYHAARNQSRKIIFHVGPTNSGKVDISRFILIFISKKKKI
jgi:type IV secretory pathway ATPase VirB11/archaellum biosynthesis ATPase